MSNTLCASFSAPAHPPRENGSSGQIHPGSQHSVSHPNFSNDQPFPKRSYVHNSWMYTGTPLRANQVPKEPILCGARKTGVRYSIVPGFCQLRADVLSKESAGSPVDGGPAGGPAPGREPLAGCFGWSNVVGSQGENHACPEYWAAPDGSGSRARAQDCFACLDLPCLPMLPRLDSYALITFWCRWMLLVWSLIPPSLPQSKSPRRLMWSYTGIPPLPIGRGLVSVPHKILQSRNALSQRMLPIKSLQVLRKVCYVSIPARRRPPPPPGERLAMRTAYQGGRDPPD